MHWNNAFNSFVGNPSHFIKKIDGTSKTSICSSDIGQKSSFSRIAVHYLVMPPKSKTSIPHAEKTEEEFIFVLKGTPHLWQDGYLYSLKEGFAVGYPSGTGICHTVINNSENEVILLIAGEKTKQDNRYVYPLNSELIKDHKDYYWFDAPTTVQGENSSEIDDYTDLIDSDFPENIVDCGTLAKGESFNYPNDTETFGEGRRVSDIIGLKKLGIWYEYLPPMKRSAFPHAHSVEDEFIYLIEGEAALWINGYTKRMQSGEYASFQANTGCSHTIINRSSKNIVYLCIGESDAPNDEIYYPQHEFRNVQCRNEGIYWDKVPKLEYGTDLSHP